MVLEGVWCWRVCGVGGRVVLEGVWCRRACSVGGRVVFRTLES